MSPFEIAAGLAKDPDFQKLSPERQQAVFDAAVASAEITAAQDDLANLPPDVQERVRKHRAILEGGRQVGGQIQMPQRIPQTPQGALRRMGGQVMTPGQEEGMLENSQTSAQIASALAGGVPAVVGKVPGTIGALGRFAQTPFGDAAVAAGTDLVATRSPTSAARTGMEALLLGKLTGGKVRGRQRGVLGRVYNWIRKGEQAADKGAGATSRVRRMVKPKAAAETGMTGLPSRMQPTGSPAALVRGATGPVPQGSRIREAMRLRPAGTHPPAQFTPDEINQFILEAKSSGSSVGQIYESLRQAGVRGVGKKTIQALIKMATEAS